MPKNLEFVLTESLYTMFKAHYRDYKKNSFIRTIHF